MSRTPCRRNSDKSIRFDEIEELKHLAFVTHFFMKSSPRLHAVFTGIC